MSSKYVKANDSPRKTESISRWKDAGAPDSPNGIRQKWYRPIPGPGQNAVLG